MAISTASVVELLEAEYLANLTKLRDLPGLYVQSEQGRSLNSVDSLRDSLTRRQREIEKTLAQLGSPIGGIEEPFDIRAVSRPGS